MKVVDIFDTNSVAFFCCALFNRHILTHFTAIFSFFFKYFKPRDEHLDRFMK